MSRKQFAIIKDKLAAIGGWAMHSSSLGFFLPGSVSYRNLALHRAAADGTLVRLGQGFYLFPGLKRPFNYLEQVAGWFRPNDFFYLSLESALSDAGEISQVTNRLTFMTTGRSHTYYLPNNLGCIEFVHTKVPPEEWGDQVYFNKARGIRVATPEKARLDLRRTGRCLDLVRDDELMYV